MGVPPHLPQAETDLEEFFDLSIDLLCVVGLDGYFKRVNASLERTLGYEKPELFSQTVFDITHPDDVEPSREALAQLAEGRDIVGFESRVICADGAVRWLQWNTRTMPERGVVYGVARDVTDRRKARRPRPRRAIRFLTRTNRRSSTRRGAGVGWTRTAPCSYASATVSGKSVNGREARPTRC